MKAIQSKPGHIEVPVRLLNEVREALGAGRNLSANERYRLCCALKKLADGGYDYEVQPTTDDGQGNIEVCEPAEATQWSVYKRPRIADEHGERLAEWVADCKELKVAEALADALRKQDGGK